MVGLSDFNTPTKKPKLSDFFANSRQPNPALNEASINNIAAHTAILMDSPQEVDSTYTRVSDDLRYGTSDLVRNVVEQYNTNNEEANYQTLLDLASDASLSVEERQAAIANFRGGVDSRIANTFYQRTAMAAAMADSEPDDNDETEWTRIDTTLHLNEMDEYNGWIQKKINEAEALSNPNLLEMARDFVNLIVPFFDQAITAQVSGQFLAEDGEINAGAIAEAFTLMGNNKAAVRDALRAMPIEQRKQAAEAVINLVMNSSGPGAFTENHIFMADQLRSFLQSGSYSDVNQVVDNIFSILDATILAGPLVRGAGRATGVLRAPVDQGAMRRYEQAVKAMSEPETTRAIDEVVEQVAGQTDIPDSVMDGVRQIIGDKVVQRLEGLDNAPVEVFNDVRRIVDERVNSTTVGSPTVAKDIVDRVNALLTNRGLTGVEGRTAGNLRNSITQTMAESNIRRRMARTGVQPTSVSQAVKETNPGKARAIHQMMVNDTTGKAARAAYGTNRTDAIGNDILPEVGRADGAVRNKVSMSDEASPNPNKQLVEDVRAARGDNYLSPQEKIATRDKVKSDWRDVHGMFPRVEMSTIDDIETGVKFDMVYGPKDGGFSNPYQAIENAKYALRKYGVNDSNIEVLRKNELGEYVPTTDFSGQGNYLVRVKYDYEFSPADTIAWSLTSTDPKWRMFDAIPSILPGKSGAVYQHVIPPTAIQDRLLLDAASVASDRQAWLANRLLELANDYAKRYKALDATQQQMVSDYIIRANAHGLKFNSVHLKALGMNERAVDTVRAWKEVNDTLYWFENLDLNKTLKARGYQKFVDQANDTDLIVRPITRQAAGEVRKVFDGSTIRTVTPKELDELYEKGGTISKTRGSVEWDDDVFDYVLVDNTSSNSYLRAIRDDDITLNYRDGYYTVRYNSPYFITKKVRGKDDSEYTKAIASAEDRRSAEAMLERLRTTDKKTEYGLRPDMKRGTQAFEDSEWEQVVTNGRTSQRVRGERLGNANNAADDLNVAHIETPEESLINSIRSLSHRVSHRDFILSAKQRFLNQFSDLVPMEKGIPQWPDNVMDIGRNNAEVPLSRLADAKATFRYIDAIDSGYVNLLDDFSKTFFKFFSDVSGRLGWSWLEKGSRAAERVGPSAWARKKAFRLLLAANPLRQLPVQASQALPVILATNPTGIPRVASQFLLVNYLNRGGDVNSFFKSTAGRLTGLTREEAQLLAKHYDMAGYESAVKANSLIRDDMKSLVDRKLHQKASTLASKPLNFTQKIGFEAGENVLMRSIWLSEYDKLRRVKKSKDISMEDIENLNAKVRHLTLNMNKAGELPYNENALSAMLQFFQTPHKAFAQVVMGHKGLTKRERYTLGSMYLLTYGMGANYVTDLVSKVLPEDSGARDVLEGGFFNVLMNKALSNLYGEQVGVDFSDSLRLLEFPNLFQFWQDVMALNVSEIISSSPSVSLVFGDNPRVTRFVKALARPFTVDDERRPEEIAALGLEFLNVFSGTSNFLKARYIMEHQKVIGGTGQTVDWEANHIEALMRAAGFATMDEVRYYALNDKTYRAREAYKDDINTLITETSRRLALRGISNDEAGYYLDMLAEAQRVYGNNPFYLKEFQDQLYYRATQGEFDIFNTVLDLAGFVDRNKFESMVDTAPIPEDQKQTLRDAYRLIEESE